MALTAKDLNDVRSTVPVGVVTRGELVRVNLNVPEDTRMRWKIAAAERKVTLAELIEQAVNEYLNK